VPTGKRRILVVEDDDDLRRLYVTALMLAGFDVGQATDGLEALHYLDGATPPDLIVLDLGLPNVSGYVVRQEIAAHAHTRDIPIVIVTGSPTPADRLNVACVLRKPVTPDQLVEAVRICLPAGAPGLA
jgi:CheY-like chemotaxis protein